MRFRNSIFFLLASVLLLSWFAPRVFQSMARSAIEANFETRSLADSEAYALSVAAPRLAQVDKAEVVLSISQDSLVPILSDGLSQAAAEEGILFENLQISVGDQGIRFEGAADLDIADANISGTVNFLGDATVTLAGERLIVTPTFSSVKIAELHAGWFMLPRKISQVVTSAIVPAIEAINAKIPPVELEVPAIVFEGEKVKIGTNELDIPPKEIAASALLIADGRVLWIGQTTPASHRVPPAESFDDYRNQFHSAAGSLLQGLPADGFRLAPSLLDSLFGELADTQSLEDRVREALLQARTNARAMYRTDIATYRPDFALFLPSGQVREAIEPLLLDVLKAEARKSGIDIEDAGLIFSDGYLGAFVEGGFAFHGQGPGSVKLRVVITAIPSFFDGRVEIRPGIQEITVLETVAEGYDLEQVLTSTNGIVAGLVAGLDAALPVIPIEIDPYSIGDIDLRRQVGAGGITFCHDVVAGPTVSLANASVFVSDVGLFLLAEVTSDAATLATPIYGSAEIASGIEGLEAYFLPFSQPGNDVPNAQVAGVAISWSRLAELINAEFADIGELGAHVKNRIPRTPFQDTKIELVERPNYDCRGPGDCPFRSCSSDCSLKNCNYGCPSVGAHVPCPTLRKPFRTCYQSVEQPSCVAGRDLCRATRDADYLACKTKCDADANLGVAACQAENVARQAGCELGKRIQDLGAEIGGVGVIGGDAGASPEMRIGITQFVFDTDQIAGELHAQLSGKISVDGSISFVPYDAMNLLGCPKGKVEFSTDANLPRQALVLGITVSKDPEPDDSDGVEDLDLLATIAPFTVKADLNPRPAEAILANNPQLPFVCNPVIGAGIVGLTIVGRASALAPDDLVRGASDDVAALLSGKFEERIEATEIRVSVRTEELTLGVTTYKLVPDMAGNAISMTLER